MFGHRDHRKGRKNGVRVRAAAKRGAPGGCGVEALESRTLMTVVVTPAFGVLPQTQDGGSAMKGPPINVLFWGSYWQGSNGTDASTWDSAKSPQAEKLLGAVEQMLGSSYLNETQQYGADPRNMFLNDSAWMPSDPGSAVGIGQVDNAVQGEIGKVFPSPDNQTDGQGHQVAPIYVVITPPGTGWTPQTQDIGFNFNGGDDAAEIWEGTTGTNGDNTNIDIDLFTRLLGHEVGEMMTDPDGKGFEVGTPSAWAAAGGGGDDQIGDMEGNRYRFRMSDSDGNPSFQVQPLWSRDDQAWVVSDGTAQRFNLVPTDWNTMGSSPQFGGHFALVINGDQWLNVNDQVTFTTTSAGGVKVNLNGEVVNFDPNVLSSITLHMGGGVNTVSFANQLPSGVSMNMSASGGSIVLKAPIDSVNGWNFTDTGIGSLVSVGPQKQTVTTFNNVSSVVGGPLQDTFGFYGFGSLTGSVDGGGGGDVLDFRFNVDSAQTQPVSVNLVAGTATPIGGAFSHISVIKGSSGNDTLTGSGAWTINGANAGSVDGVQFTSFENLVGSAGNDTFTFLPGGSISGNVDGGAGTDTLDYSALAGPVTVNFDTGTATDVGSFSNMENVMASQSGNDTIVGDAWTITGVNSGTVNGVAFSGVSNLIGGSADDSFTFMPGGLITGNIDGGTGVNTVSYANLTGASTVNLVTRTGPGIGGTFANISRFVGNGSDSVVGPNVATTYTVTGINALSAGSVAFSGFSSVTAGSANDMFAINSGGKLSGKIDGGLGVNSLSYAHFTGNVFVDLALNTATNLGGESRIANVTGGIGNSLLIGDANANVLTGGPNPLLLGLGSLSRSILIGGAGADTLNAAGSQDILIGGTTAWDKNLTALSGIFAEWARTDLTFNQRVAHLASGKAGDGSLNGGYDLNLQTVNSDGASDTLNANVGQDWIFVTLGEDRLIGGTASGDITTTM